MDSKIFDQVNDRRGTNSYKWDNGDPEGTIEMWVADMDFRTAPCVSEALRRVVDRGIFGYTHVPEEYYDRVCDWFGRRHNWHFAPHDIIYTTGVVPAVSAVIKALTRPGDAVVTLTPAYNCFYSSIRNNGCRLEAVELIYEGDSYRVDFDRLAEALSADRVKLFLLCNPHNPSCRVWTREELRRMADMCEAAGVAILSDDIHCELVYEPYEYTPIASLGAEVAANTVTCVSPSKAFNTAGLQIANIVTPVEAWRRQIDRAINDNEVCDVNPFGVAGLMAAYGEGDPWLDELCRYIHGNYETLCEWARERAPRLRVTRLEGTYLAWVDCRALHTPVDVLCDILTSDAHVRLNPGTLYGPEGEGFVRFNLALPRSMLREALDRITPYLQSSH